MCKSSPLANNSVVTYAKTRSFEGGRYLFPVQENTTYVKTKLLLHLRTLVCTNTLERKLPCHEYFSALAVKSDCDSSGINYCKPPLFTFFMPPTC